MGEIKNLIMKKFEQLKSAVIHCKSVKIHYARSSYEAITEKSSAAIQSLFIKAKAWYLKAFCTQKQDWRLFKLNRILKLEIFE